MANNCWYCRKGGIVDLYFAGRTGVCPICRSGVNVQFDVGRFVTLDNITTEVDNWAKSSTGSSESNEPLTMAQLKALPDGTKLYSYTDYGKKFEGIVTAHASEKKIRYKNGGYNWFNQSAIDGKDNCYNRRLYLKDPKSNGGNSGTQREYKVGDRVTIASTNIGNMYNGEAGVIVEIDLTYDYPYLVRTDSGHKFWSKVTVDDKPLTTEELMQMNGQKVWCSVLLSDGEHFKGHSSIGWFTVDTENERLLFDNGSYYSMGSNGEKYGFRAYRTDQSHRANEDWEEEIQF